MGIDIPGNANENVGFLSAQIRSVACALYTPCTSGKSGSTIVEMIMYTKRETMAYEELNASSAIGTERPSSSLVPHRPSFVAVVRFSINK